MIPERNYIVHVRDNTARLPSGKSCGVGEEASSIGLTDEQVEHKETAAADEKDKVERREHPIRRMLARHPSL